MPGSGVDDSGILEAGTCWRLGVGWRWSHHQNRARGGGRARIFETGVAPGCCQEELYATNATSFHKALARDCFDSVVMLKNATGCCSTGRGSPSSAARARRSTTPRRS